jgi:hypothetical protein
MIKDITKIRERLVGFTEIDALIYEFSRNDEISYICLKINQETFYPGGEFRGIGDNCVFLEKNGSRWKAPLSLKNPDGSIRYKCRFFVKRPELVQVDSDSEFKKTIDFQQGIIDKLTVTLKQLEYQKHELTSQNFDLGNKLEVIHQVNIEKDSQITELSKKVNYYKRTIEKLSNSHPLMIGN